MTVINVVIWEVVLVRSVNEVIWEIVLVMSVIVETVKLQLIIPALIKKIHCYRRVFQKYECWTGLASNPLNWLQYFW